MANYKVDTKDGRKWRKAEPAYQVNWIEEMPDDALEVGTRVSLTNNLGAFGVVTEVYPVMANNGLGHRYGVLWDDGTETYPPPVCKGRPQDGQGHDEALMQYIPYRDNVLFVCPVCGRSWNPPVPTEQAKEWDQMDRHIRQPYSIHLKVVNVPKITHASPTRKPKAKKE